MALDDLPLALQRTLDRLIRRMRLGPAPLRTRSRLLVVQIDGLSHAMLARAMAEGAMPFLEEDVFGEHSAYERDGVRVISAGPNALLCVVDTPGPRTIEQLEPRFPGLAEAISRSPGIGFVLARTQGGPVCFWRGKRDPLGPGEPGPFRDRRDAALVNEGIMDLMAMPSAGDLVIYGIDAPEGHVSFIPEAGAHARPSPEELHAFPRGSARRQGARAHHPSRPALRALRRLPGASVTPRFVADREQA